MSQIFPVGGKLSTPPVGAITAAFPVGKLGPPVGIYRGKYILSQYLSNDDPGVHFADAIANAEAVDIDTLLWNGQDSLIRGTRTADDIKVGDGPEDTSYGIGGSNGFQGYFRGIDIQPLLPEPTAYVISIEIISTGISSEVGANVITAFGRAQVQVNREVTYLIYKGQQPRTSSGGYTNWLEFGQQSNLTKIGEGSLAAGGILVLPDPDQSLAVDTATSSKITALFNLTEAQAIDILTGLF